LGEIPTNKVTGSKKLVKKANIGCILGLLFESLNC